MTFRSTFAIEILVTVPPSDPEMQKTEFSFRPGLTVVPNEQLLKSGSCYNINKVAVDNFSTSKPSIACALQVVDCSVT